MGADSAFSQFSLKNRDLSCANRRYMVARTKHIFTLGAGLAGLAVMIGAFGAHFLKNLISTDMLVVFETGNRYQMYHSIALFIAGWGMKNFQLPIFEYAAWCFLAGIVLFSGSLYVLAVTGITWLGVLTPLGGITFLAGWVCLFIGFHRSPS